MPLVDNPGDSGINEESGADNVGGSTSETVDEPTSIEEAFRIISKDFDSIYYKYSVSPTQGLSGYNFRPDPSKHLEATVHTPANTWEIASPCPYHVNDNPVKFVLPGSYPCIGTAIKCSIEDVGVYYLSRSNTGVVIKQGSTTGTVIWEATADSFIDKVVPSRMIFMLQGAGGGGGGHNYGQGGGGGGAGAFVAGVLALDGYTYKIDIGAGGAGGPSNQGGGYKGNNGQDSTIYKIFNPSVSYQIARAGGGSGGDSDGNKGKGGTASAINTTYAYNLPSLINGGSDTQAILNGADGAVAGGDGQASTAITIYSTFDSTYQSYNRNKRLLSSNAGGSDGGGGASVFAPGAIEGDLNDAVKGAGGGGARGWSSNPSSDGGAGCFYLIY